MNTEKFQVNFAEGQTKGELILREGKAVDQLPLKAPIKIALVGVIGAPVEFLNKRISEFDQINQKKCHVIIDREKISITLITSEDNADLTGNVQGILMQHPKFIEFGINAKKNWEPNELGQFFKMNRAFFPDRSANMALVTQLKNFIATVNSTIEKEKNESGSFKDNFSGTVSSNLPGMFTLRIPIFKGIPAEDLEIEFYASVDGRDVRLQLYSPGANTALEDLRDKVIEEQIELIRNIAPEIAIIEK